MKSITKIEMLNAQHVHPQDFKENARIQRTRMYEEERKARIFNTRTRIIGVCTFKNCII